MDAFNIQILGEKQNRFSLYIGDSITNILGFHSQYRTSTY